MKYFQVYFLKIKPNIFINLIVIWKPFPRKKRDIKEPQKERLIAFYVNKINMTGTRLMNI